MTRGMEKKTEVDTDRGLFFSQETFSFHWLNPYLVPAVDFHFLPNEIDEVNIPSRNPRRSENMF